MTDDQPKVRPGDRVLPISGDSILAYLWDLLAIPSPTGYTDSVVRYVCHQLDAIGVDYELTRRGAIRVNLPGRQKSPDRAVVGHVDTLGAQVRGLRDNGRPMLVPIGTWSARFAEGARVTVFSETGVKRGTILPLKAAGHAYNTEIDTQPAGWDNVELRLDEITTSPAETRALGVHPGDFVAVDPLPELSENGFINSRYLDDKAGVAAMLAALKAIQAAEVDLPVACHFLFTISEEVGSGASAVLHGDVAELLAVDNGVQAPGQSSTEFGVTLGMADQTGPFDYHLTQLLLELCRRHQLPHQRDIFTYYRCDAASAVAAGNDIRTALATFGVDASHGYERTHINALETVAKLLTAYVQAPPAVARDRFDLASLNGFPDQPTD